MSHRVNHGYRVETVPSAYDGWNAVRESADLHIPPFAVTSTSHYVWGSDLSCTPQGADGIGGLPGAQGFRPAYLPCNDANEEQKSAKGKRTRSPAAILRLA
ncbi:MAG: hypothetical protein FWG50_04360 [Kiritimatiellaeota bacterium]|nr:hypothetical protein [Kiritimatiellota bacterium]